MTDWNPYDIKKSREEAQLATELAEQELNRLMYRVYEGTPLAGDGAKLLEHYVNVFINRSSYVPGSFDQTAFCEGEKNVIREKLTRIKMAKEVR